MIVSDELKEKLRNLAGKYENADFVTGDPCRVLKRYTEQADVETAAFIAAVLAFGRRDQFLPKIDYILDLSDKDGGPAEWIRSQRYTDTFVPNGIDKAKKFYRFYSYGDMLDVFSALNRILNESHTLGGYFSGRYATACTESGCSVLPLAPVVCAAFEGCSAVPHGKDTANKRINMYLRWMVRRNSPVDLGLWSWYSPSDLIMPLDTHVIQEAVALGLLPPKSGGSIKTAAVLTCAMKQIWPEDPCLGDFALFGLGVDGNRV